MYTIRPRPVRSHNHAELLQTEQFFQNGSLAWLYDRSDDDHDADNDAHDGFDSDSAPAHMDVGHFRWFWPWGVRRSSTFDAMPSGKQRLPVAALLPPSSASTSSQPSSLLLTRLPPELRLKIWRLVLRTRCSTRWPYHPRSPAWRPDRRGAPCIDVALLRTCRAVYAEAWDLPMRLTTAALADGTPTDKPSEWAPVVLAADVLVPHAWQVLLLRRAEVTMQHFRLEAGFLEMWLAALGKLKAAAAACVADLVAAARARGTPLDEGVVARLGAGQPLEEVVVRMNRMDWWTWTSVPPPPWPDGLPGECVADVRAAARRSRRKRRRRRSSVEDEREREAEREQWTRRKAMDDGEDASSELETDEEDEEAQQEDEGDQDGTVLERTTTLSETSYDQFDDPPPQNQEDTDDHDAPNDSNDDDEQGGYFSDHTASSTASSLVYVFDAATLPASLALAPLRTETWDRPAAYGVLSPNLRVTLMLETFGPKSLQLDEVLAEARTWRLPMPLVHAGAVRAGAAVEDRTGRVLAWDGRPVREYHWLRDAGDDEAEFLRMGEFRATAEGVVVKMMSLVPRSF